MVRRRPGDKPLPEQMLINLPTHSYASLGLNGLFKRWAQTSHYIQIGWVNYLSHYRIWHNPVPLQYDCCYLICIWRRTLLSQCEWYWSQYTSVRSWRLLDSTPSSRRLRATIGRVVVLFLLNPVWGFLSSGSNMDINLSIAILLYSFIAREMRLLPLYSFWLHISLILGTVTMSSVFHLSGMWQVVNIWLTKQSTMSSTPPYLRNLGVMPSSPQAFPQQNCFLSFIEEGLFWDV